MSENQNGALLVFNYEDAPDGANNRFDVAAQTRGLEEIYDSVAAMASRTAPRGY